MPTTFTALYERREDAERVQAELERLGIIDVDGMNLHDRNNANVGSDGGAGGDRGFFDQLRDLFVTEEDSHHFAEGVRRGHALLTVRTDDRNADRVHDVLENSGAIDVDEQAASWKKEGWTAPAAAAGTAGAAAGAQRLGSTDASARRDNVAEERIPVVEEQLVVGKREVSRGGVRVRSYVEEKPVNEQVTLREEHVDIERRPVNQPLRAGELGDDPFRNREIEVTETAEEAVVAKEARVVEEVVVEKGVEERTETVSDTVRRTNVEVENLNDQQSTSDRGATFDRDRRDNDLTRR